MTAAATEPSLQVINFKTRDFYGSIDISYISKVIALPQLNYAPDAPDYVIGIINNAGKILPVIDLSQRLNISEPTRYSIDTPIIICRTQDDTNFGLIVKEIYDLLVISRSMLQKTPAKMNNKIVLGAIKFPAHISLLIDVNNLLDESILSN